MSKDYKCVSLCVRKCFARFVLLCCFSFLFSESYGDKVQLFKLDGDKIRASQVQEIIPILRAVGDFPLVGVSFFLEQVCLSPEDLQRGPSEIGPFFEKDFTLAPEFDKAFQKDGILAIKAVKPASALASGVQLVYKEMTVARTKRNCFLGEAGFSCKAITDQTDHRLRIFFPQGMQNDFETFVSVYLTPPPNQRAQVVIHQVTYCSIPSFMRPSELPPPPDYYKASRSSPKVSLFPHFAARFERPAPDAPLELEVSFQEEPVARLTAGQLTFSRPEAQQDFDGPPYVPSRSKTFPRRRLLLQVTPEIEGCRLYYGDSRTRWTQRVLEFQEPQEPLFLEPQKPLSISVLWSREEKPPVLEVTLGVRRLVMPRYAVVFFNSYTDQSRFQRLRYFQGLNVVTICIPDITPSPQNHGMWYCGPVGKNYYERYATLVRNLLSAEGIPESQVLLIGSSMGGFMALKMAELLPEASVFAYNPQTDFMRFLEGEFFESKKRASLMASLLGREPRHQDRLDVLLTELRTRPEFILVQSASIDPLRLGARPESRRRCIAYFQHMRDAYHFKNHYRPFLETLSQQNPQRLLFQIEERFQNPSDFRIPHPGILVVPFGDGEEIEASKAHLAKGPEFEIPIVDRILQFMEEQRLSEDIQRFLTELRRPYEDFIIPEVLEVPPTEPPERPELMPPPAEPPSPDTDESGTSDPEKPGSELPKAEAPPADEPPPPPPS